MRRLLFFVALSLLAACSGGDGESADSAATSTEAAAELPSLTSVPFEEYGTNHIDPPAVFATSPSTGGDHYPFWQNCGYYTEAVTEGGATHTLEHGAVWITYNADVVTDLDLTVLQSLSQDNGKLLITPYEQEEAIILSAWGVQQRGVAAPGTPEGKEVIDAFLTAWVDNPALTEAGVSCQGSLGVPPDSPRVFPDGLELPAEFT